MNFWKSFSFIVEGETEKGNSYFITFKVVGQSRNKAGDFLKSTDEYREILNASIDEIMDHGVNWRSSLFGDSPRILSISGRAFFDS